MEIVIDLPARLERELRRRRGRNPRYSLRAFARSLRTNHSTLSRILHQRRRLSSATIAKLGSALGLTAEEMDSALLAQTCATILELADDPEFRPDSRWLAMRANVPVDTVNRALHWVLYQRQLVMADARRWRREARG